MFTRIPKTARRDDGDGPNISKALAVARFDIKAWEARRAAAGRPVTTNLPDRGVGHRMKGRLRNR